jgi:hypothetical protein
MKNSDTLQPVSTEHLGQKYAFALASLLLGIASFVHVLGIEKAILAIVFGVLAMRPPVARLHKHWAKTGIVLGGVMIFSVLFALFFFHEELLGLVAQLIRLS